MPRATISAFIVCMNEEHQIERCLKSVSWCDEIVVVDSGSVDGTLAVCERYGARIFSRAWPGYVAQKRFALEACEMEWVLNLDADEEVSPALAAEIQTILSSGTSNYQGYSISRVVFFLGKWWRKGCWYPEYRLRFCRRTRTTWGGKDPHEKALVDGATTRLKGELYHYTYADISHQIRTLNSYSSQAAQSMLEDGKKFSLVSMGVNPLARFIKCFVLKRGYREGFSGLIVSLLEAYYVLLKYVKLWELQRPAPTKP